MVEIFSESLNNVVIRSNEGKTENCNGSLLNIERRRINNAKDIFILSSKSNRNKGTGIIIIITIEIMDKETKMSPNFIKDPPKCCFSN